MKLVTLNPMPNQKLLNRRWRRTYASSLRGLCAVLLMAPLANAQEPTASIYAEKIQPILERHCYDCHGYGSDEGGVSFDSFESEKKLLSRKDLWLKALDNVRAGLMPPPDEVAEDSRPTKDEIATLVHWVKFEAFGIDPNHPDPGHSVPRRLNRVEYQNTMRDLMGYEFRADREFPPDDTGSGFDNNGEVLTLSTLLIEKYLASAESIVADAVPQAAPTDKDFVDDENKKENKSDKEKRDQKKDRQKKAKRLKENYARFFPDAPAPPGPSPREAYAATLLRRFASRAFRRPVEDRKVDQLVQLAKSVYTSPDQTFEQGVSRAMMAVLASPHFLFRVSTPVAEGVDRVALLDEFSLASRLSYFLWSSMPDAELMDLAERGQLRAELDAQVQRMLKDPKVESGLVQNFGGQWLQTRDIHSVEINGKAVLGKGPVNGNRRTKYDFDNKIRTAMRSETEKFFAYVLEKDRSILDFIDSDYAFLNEQLAEQYDIDGVKGKEFRLVKLPSGSYRGGVLTQGSVLAVTSNPTRTSPVKRGVFILENILGTPPPPPPPNVTDLESSIEEGEGKQMKLSDVLALHRKADVCSSCHNRMDPIGLAFENFIPMGNWRDEEAGQPIEAAGTLITGESFQDIRELKRVLANERRVDFYRCISRKMLTYAIGRGLTHQDTHTVDLMVDRLMKDEGRISSLIMSTIESAPFQKQRRRTAAN